MPDESWRKVREIFDSALRRKPEERRRFIAEACGEDIALLDEVESLLASLDSSESFMETPAVAGMADAITSNGRKLENGYIIGHYEIVEPIGTGGMGEVYRARDQVLDRQVAVKILNEKFSNNESNLKRFFREARAASALNHPNILVIHEIGASEEEHFIVSEFINGKTLREVFKERVLSVSEILDTSIQVANALSAAHEAHLIHRDIKPENIMIRPDGFVKVLDFGLAKLVEQKNLPFLGPKASAEVANHTAKGVILGTVNYMSPEQAKGEATDERTDVFSFGVVIYEMIAGRTPFAGDSMSETFANLINAEPYTLGDCAADLPRELPRCVFKMLRKKKVERYQTMKELLTDLKDLRDDLTFDEKLERSASPNAHVTEGNRATTGENEANATAEAAHGVPRQMIRHKSLAATASMALLFGVIGLGYYLLSAVKPVSSTDGKRSIAVLPLKPTNTTNRDELYEIGIAESLIYKISSMNGFVVRHLSATRQYTDINQNPLVAGREQRVDYVLASNYQLADGKIRIIAQLINVATGQVEETYKGEKDAANLFAMQDAIAGEVGNLLMTRFATSLSGPTPKRGTTNEEAYRLYLQGMILYDQRRGKEAVETFEKAVILDPNYALAWAGKAHAHRTRAWASAYSDRTEQYQRSIDAAHKALALDPSLSEGYSALCENRFAYEYDFAGAERDCRRALEIDPDSSRAHNIYALFLSGRGRNDEAFAEIKTAIDLEPTSYYNQRVYANVLYFARRYDEAIAQYKRLIEMNEDKHATYQWLIRTFEAQGNEPEAFEWLIRSLTLAKEDDETIQRFKTAYQASGWRGVLLERDRTSGDSNYFRRAGFNARLREKDKAFEYLARAYQQRDGLISWLQVEPQFDALRDDPRFDELARRVEFK